MRKAEDVTLKDGINLKEVLKLHEKWLKEEKGGKRADLSYEDLSDVDLKDINLRYVFLIGANLRGANLIGANLIGAELIDANLRGANLRGAYLNYAELIDANLIGVNLADADLTGANLSDVNLEGSNLTRANLRYADLEGADLKRTNLTDIKYNNTTSFFVLQCPEEGSFIGYKKANDKIVKLLITEDAKRSSATTRKCRCNKAKVLSITSLDGKEEYTKVNSDYDSSFTYEVGKIIEVKDFDENRWKGCSTGIHFFITRDEAVMY